MDNVIPLDVVPRPIPKETPTTGPTFDEAILKKKAASYLVREIEYRKERISYLRSAQRLLKPHVTTFADLGCMKEDEAFVGHIKERLNDVLDEIDTRCAEVSEVTERMMK